MGTIKLQAFTGKLVSVQEAGTDAATVLIARTPAPPAEWPFGYTWEEFTEHSQADGSLALSCAGRYLSAQPDGSLQCNRTEIGAWELFRPYQDGTSSTYQSVAHGTVIYVDVSKYVETEDWSGYQLGMRNPLEWRFTVLRDRPPHEDALVGRLVARNGLFYDDTGPRLPQFFHVMPLIRVFHDDRAKFDQALAAGVKAGRHGIRFGYTLVETETQDGGYWAGCHVPLDMAMDLMCPVLEALANASLRAHIFGANNFGGNWTTERDWIRQLLQKIADAGHSETVALFSWRNEPFMTSPYGGHSQETYTHGAEAMQIAKDTLGCITCMGAMGEDDGYIAGTVVHGE